MGCCFYPCYLYEESKKRNIGCLDVMKQDYAQCCSCPHSYSEEELAALKIASSLQFGDNDYHRKIYDNHDHNVELLKKISEENEKSKEIMKSKLDSLLSDGRAQNPKVIIGTGNSCNNDCYLYNLNLMTTCPKCDGKVDEDFENGYTTEQKWNDSRNAYEEVKRYNETKICTGFRWNKNVSECDVTLKGMFEYFDKTDPEKKTHYSIVVEDKDTKEKKTEEVDAPNHYMMINGERFDFPMGMTMWQFFHANNEYFYPRGKTTRVKAKNGGFIYVQNLDYCYRTPFWYEGLRVEIGQSFGYYGYAWRHMVYIYTCNSCGYKYHIVKTSPFAFRDKSKDPK